MIFTFYGFDKLISANLTGDLVIVQAKVKSGMNDEFGCASTEKSDQQTRL
ncbi:hypothetical protein THF1C08_20110 [Vibrio jasicida]|uniref:Uncharacterized protein n=1 Tax=Vibrio jasicida TaxID=766224 RepID=A0AAU9QIV6_9VIBR|nr:hypothetical protein THF1C08_20110 [Vibrio jasicida]CAH1584762.1 hypothetical protein THF1A12_20111 [Vibrio jasicida]